MTFPAVLAICDQLIPLTKASDAELCCFRWSEPDGGGNERKNKVTADRLASKSFPQISFKYTWDPKHWFWWDVGSNHQT